MFLRSGKQLSQKLWTSAWRSFATEEKPPYWRAKFPDRIASFDEIPAVAGGYDLHKLPQVAEEWFKTHGHVVKEPVQFGKYTVHLFHFHDFRTVYQNDGIYPIRQSHHAIAQYRNERKHLYDYVGLGAGQGPEWLSFRRLISSKMALHDSVLIDQVVEELIRIIKNNLNDKGEIELLPWLHRWAFENIGALALNRRLNALSEVGNERADKMVAAGALTDELIALTTMDPVTMYEERYKQLVEAQDFFYSVLKKYIDDIKRDMELEPETDGIVQNLLKDKSCSEKNAVTLIMDLFQGALQTVPLTALMTLYNLARHSGIQALAREEARAEEREQIPVRGSKSLIRSVIYETFRLNPPIIGNGRLIQKDLVLGGYNVPSYTNVILHFQVACRQEENYKDALEFMPERKGHNRVDYLFGGDGRMCVGRIFTLRQLRLVVPKMVRNFEIFYDGDEVKMINTLHNKPEKPLILRLKPIEE